MARTRTPAPAAAAPPLPTVPEDLPGWQWEFNPTRGMRLVSPLDGYTTKWTAPDLEGPAVVEARQLVAREQADADPRPPLLDLVTAQDAGAAVPLPLTQLDDNPYQPRLVYDDERIAAIAASIRQHGLLQAPLGRLMPDGRVQLAFGHSRLRAFRALAADDAAHFGRMPVLLRTLDDETMALHAWIENRDRKDLTAYEEAKAIERYTSSFGWTQKQAAAKLQLTQPTIANKLRLLRLPDAALRQLEAGQLSERQAAALLPLMELPERARSAPIQHWTGKGYLKDANDLIAQAAEFDSAQLRSLVERFLDTLTIALAKQPWRNDPIELPGVVASLCSECPIRLKSSDRCPDKACAERKASAQRVAQADAAATAAGLPAAASSGYGTYDDLSGVNLTAIRAKAAEKRCGNLSVIWLEHSYAPHGVKGHPNCSIVCAHGRGKRCGCKQALARSADPAVSKEAKQRHERARITQELLGPTQNAITAALATPSAGLWRLLLGRLSSSAAAKLPADADEPTARAAYVAELVRETVRYHLEYGADYAGAQRDLLRLLSGLGQVAPWADHSRANTADTEPLNEQEAAA